MMLSRVGKILQSMTDWKVRREGGREGGREGSIQIVKSSCLLYTQANLYLYFVPSSDVRESPTCLLPHAVMDTAQEMLESRQN